MCGLCGALGPGLSWELEIHSPGDTHRDRALEAHASAAELTRLLWPLRIRVSARTGYGFAITFPTGGTELVTGMVGVWHAIERKRLELPDPLAG
jgi:hypothetical protein